MFKRYLTSQVSSINRVLRNTVNSQISLEHKCQEQKQCQQESDGSEEDEGPMPYPQTWQPPNQVAISLPRQQLNESQDNLRAELNIMEGQTNSHRSSSITTARFEINLCYKIYSHVI